eukprot:2625848-Prymnesium_polylepis.1
MPKLSTREKAELTAFRSAEKVSPATPLSLTEDQEVGSLEKISDKYEWVKNHVTKAQLTDPHAQDKFWFDCDGLCQKGGGGGGKGDARAELKRVVWRVLQPLQEWVTPGVYEGLYGDRDRGNVMNRALMLHVPFKDIQTEYSRAQQTGHAGDTITKTSLPAAVKMPLLR